METAGVASETSIRRSKRERKVQEPYDAGASKPSGSTGGGGGAGQGSRGDEDFEDLLPKARRKRAPNVRSIDLDDNHRLIDIIKYNAKLIPHVVRRLVEQYELDTKSAMVEILMMLFEVCGAKYQLDVDSIEETDVDDVVVSLVDLARKSEVEDIYNSKQKELKNFKDNLASFWDSLVLECQNGSLYDRVLFEKCMDYVIALSCTPPRVYRQVASLVGLQLVTSFITVAKTLCGQRETTQRQLNAEKKKRDDGPRVESLTVF